jgi:hypothetical protein
MRAWNGAEWVTLPAATAASMANTPAGSIAATTVQDALNELDAKKANLASPQFTGSVVAESSPASVGISALAQASYGLVSMAQGNGATAGSATISFHRPGIYAVHFGLDTDNKLKVGGWTMGANAYAIYHENNILGTVSQSAGVPTGAVIERGSNANGEYVRFADGTQICTQTKTVNGLAIGALTSFTFTSAASFVAVPKTVVSVFADGFTLEITYGLESHTISGGNAFAKNNGPTGPRDLSAFWVSVGRWY